MKRLSEPFPKRRDEPEWMLDYRLKAYEIYKNKPIPEWGPDLSGIDFNDITYYQNSK